jgi:hypothetical protein
MHDWAPFHHTIEDVYGVLAQYYDLQWLSLRNAAYRCGTAVIGWGAWFRMGAGASTQDLGWDPSRQPPSPNLTKRNDFERDAS